MAQSPTNRRDMSAKRPRSAVINLNEPDSLSSDSIEVHEGDVNSELDVMYSLLDSVHYEITTLEMKAASVLREADTLSDAELEDPRALVPLAARVASATYSLRQARNRLARLNERISI